MGSEDNFAFDHQEGSCLYREVYFRKPVRRSYWECPLKPRQPTPNIDPMSTLPIGAWQCFALICTSLFDDRYYTLLWILSNSWSNLQTQSFFPWSNLNSWIGVLHKSGNNNVGKNHFESQAARSEKKFPADTGFWRRGFEIWTGKGGPLKRFLKFRSGPN